MKMDICELNADFAPYGRVVAGYPFAGLMAALKRLPASENLVFAPHEERLYAAPDAEVCGERFFGGLPYQWGYCSGKNRRAAALRWHGGGQLCLGAEDFILLVARRQDLQDNALPASRVRAFRVPAGVAVELYDTTLRSLPCSCQGQPFRVLIGLYYATGSALALDGALDAQDALLCARNTWQVGLAEEIEV